MIANCTHCGAQYQLPDKMLGKQARCKACKKSFVIVPSQDEVELPEPTGSTAMMNPVGHEEDGLEALANAASGTDFPPAPRTAPSHRRHDDEERRAPRKMAKGAKPAMAMGITACALVAAALVTMIIAMVKGSDQDLLFVLGPITIALLAIAGVLAMTAVVNGTSAKSKIKRARHPLAGANQASTGNITGTIALGLVFACAVTIGIYLAKNPEKLTVKKEVIESSSTAHPADRNA